MFLNSEREVNVKIEDSGAMVRVLCFSLLSISTSDLLVSNISDCCQARDAGLETAMVRMEEW